MNLIAATTWLPSVQDLRLFRPELILIATIVAVLAVPLVVGRKPLLVGLLAMLGAAVAALATSGLALELGAGGRGAMVPAQVPLLPPVLIADGFTVFFRLMLLIFLMLIVWLWMIGETRRQEPGASDFGGGIGSPEFFVLLLTSALGMILMVSTLNLLVIIVAMETASLPSYAMVASDRRSRLGAEAALKYVMFGAASAAIMVYGASLLYGRFGTLDISTIARAVMGQGAVSGGAAATGADPVFWLGLLALGAGLAFKIAAVPMHYWCPDVFEGAPIEVTTWLSVASKAAGLGLLLRIVDAFSLHAASSVQPLAWGIGALAALTCTVGNLAALRQESVKRILAYSSIAHAGYMMMAAAIFVGPAAARGLGPTASVGIAAVVAYLMVYLIMNAGAFGATALVVWQTGSDHLSSFTGLGRRAPWLALPMAVCLFSLVGLPPLGGFAAKWFLITALGEGAAAQPWLWALVIVAVVNTALSLYYYVRIVRQMYLTDDETAPALHIPAAGLGLVNACALALLLLGTLWFGPLGRRADAMASNLFGHTVLVQAESTLALNATAGQK